MCLQVFYNNKNVRLVRYATELLRTVQINYIAVNSYFVDRNTGIFSIMVISFLESLLSSRSLNYPESCTMKSLLLGKGNTNAI